MKKIIYTATISLVVLFASCDYVSNPFPVKNGNVSYDTASCPTTFPADTSHIKKILMEDFTGHNCPNCPRAARSIHICDSTYPGHINEIALHVSGLAAPSIGFPDDYRTTIGTTYDNFFGVSAFGLPGTMINARDYNGTTFSHIKLYPFQSYVAGIVNDPAAVQMQIAVTYNSSTQKVYLSVRDSFLTATSGTYRLVVLVTQDSIIGPQDDAPPYPTTEPNYIFDHMLRDAVTGLWGDPLIGTSASAGLTQVRHYAYTLPATYGGITVVPNHCHIVAYIYNYTTYEIIQSEDVKVTN